MNRSKEKGLRRTHTAEQILLLFRNLFIDKMTVFLLRGKYVSQLLFIQKLLHVERKILINKRRVPYPFVIKVIHHQSIGRTIIARNKKSISGHYSLYLLINRLIHRLQVTQCIRSRECSPNFNKRGSFFGVSPCLFIQTRPFDHYRSLVSKQLEHRHDFVSWTQAVKGSIRCQKAQQAIVAANQWYNQHIFRVPV